MENLHLESGSGRDRLKRPSLPKNIDIENASEIISILGEEKVLKVYNITAWQPVSFAALVKIIKFKEIEIALEKDISFKDISSKTNVSRKTIYRIFKKKLNDKLKKLKSL